MRRHGERPAGHRGGADRDHGAGNQAARKVSPRETTGRRRCRSTSVSSILEGLGAAGDGDRHRCGDLAHAALWQIRAAGDKCASAMQQCASVLRSASDNGRGGWLRRATGTVARPRSSTLILPSRDQEGEDHIELSVIDFLVLGGLLALGPEFLALLAMQSLGVGFLGAFERFRGCGLLRPSFRRRRHFAGVAAGAGGGLRETRS